MRSYLTRALCLRLGDGSTIPVHDRFLGASGTSIAAGVPDGSRRLKRPPRREGEPRAKAMFRS